MPEGAAMLPRKIVLIDLKGLVYATSDPKLWKIGEVIESVSLQKLLRDVYILFGSYPLMKDADFTDLNEKERICFGTILEQHALRDRHQVAFLNDKKLRETFKVDLNKYIPADRKPAEIPRLPSLPVPDKEVTLCSSPEDIHAALLHKQRIVTCVDIKWSAMVEKFKYIYEQISLDRRIELAQVEILCKLVLDVANKYPHDRRYIAAVAKHIVNIQSLLEFLHLEDDLK